MTIYYHDRLIIPECQAARKIFFCSVYAKIQVAIKYYTKRKCYIPSVIFVPHQEHVFLTWSNFLQAEYK